MSGTEGDDPVELSLEDLRRCFEGVVPAVIATAGADGTPNVTYLPKIRVVDERRYGDTVLLWLVRTRPDGGS